MAAQSHFLPDSTEFFQTGQLFLSSSNEQRHGAATSYQRSDSINTGGCKKPTAQNSQMVKFSINVSAFKSGLQDCSSTSAWCSPQPKSMCLLLLAPILHSDSSASCCLELCCVLVAAKSAVVVHKLREGLRDASPSNICCWRWMGRPRAEVTAALRENWRRFPAQTVRVMQLEAPRSPGKLQGSLLGMRLPKKPRCPKD